MNEVEERDVDDELADGFWSIEGARRGDPDEDGPKAEKIDAYEIWFLSFHSLSGT